MAAFGGPRPAVSSTDTGTMRGPVLVVLSETTAITLERYAFLAGYAGTAPPALRQVINRVLELEREMERFRAALATVMRIEPPRLDFTFDELPAAPRRQPHRTAPPWVARDLFPNLPMPAPRAAVASSPALVRRGCRGK